MTKEYNIYMDTSGRMVIPVAIRKALDIHARTRLIARVDNGELHISTMKSSIKKAKDLVSKYCKGKDLVKELHAMRREESAKELKDFEKWRKDE
jgi:bifunctional DNA-binding transcriptional regulator/antitoxin component of YhaV-PrlF toxin-antitoxin module